MPQPDLILTPFAQDAPPSAVDPIPESRAPSDPLEKATWTQGFPGLTMIPLAAGGIPPRGQDVNGVLKAISEHVAFQGGGGQYRWSAEYVAAKGGYEKGAVIQSDDGLRSYVSVVDNNTDNFNTVPSAIGDTWQPWSGGAASELVAGLIQLATTAEAQALTNGERAITPNTLGDAMNAHVLGMGQTWQDVASSRSFDTAYTNTTGRIIYVVVEATRGPTSEYSLNVDGYRRSGGANRGGGTGASIIEVTSALVLPGETYEAVNSYANRELQSWRELR